MYCPNCGEKLISPNQKFCQACGANLIELIPNRKSIEKKSIIQSRVQPLSRNNLEFQYKNQQMQIYEKRGSKTYAKICFALGFISFIISQISGFISYLIIPLPYLVILCSIINITGLILGSLSRVYKTKSEEQEVVTGLRKAGSVFSSIGIVFNLIYLILSIILAAIGFLI